MEEDEPMGGGESEPEQRKSGTPRLYIKELVMRNFKSYAGEQRVGPFHKVRILRWLDLGFLDFELLCQLQYSFRISRFWIALANFSFFSIWRWIWAYFSDFCFWLVWIALANYKIFIWIYWLGNIDLLNCWKFRVFLRWLDLMGVERAMW